MAELGGLSIKVPIRFSEKAQKDLYETCLAYKELAEMRGAENEKLRELVRDMLRWMPCQRPCSRCQRYEYPSGCEFERRRRELGVEVN